MEFEWDQDKAESNLRKHGVAFAEAMTVFEDRRAVIAYNPFHSAEEDRYLILGLSNNHRLLVVSFTDRDDRVRLISSRGATRRQRKDYEDVNFP